MLDLTNPDAVDWLRGVLHDFQAEGVDGFKLELVTCATTDLTT